MSEGDLFSGPQSLEPAIRRVWQYSSLIGWSIAGIVGTVIEFFIRRETASPVPWIAPLIWLLMAVISWRLALVQYRQWNYELTDSALIMRHGWLWRQTRFVPRGRVQHLDINSGPLDRRFGLVQMSIFVAGSAGTVGSIPGMTPDRAEALRQRILVGRHADA